MNLFELFVNSNQKNNSRNWIETFATFTGRCNKAATGIRGHFRELDYMEYEVFFYIGEKKQRAWYCFHPLPDPTPEEIAGERIRIRYNKRKPFIIKAATEVE